MSPEQNRKLILMIAIAMISLNLRPAIAGVGPLISEIRADTGLSNSVLGLLTTLPVLAFGFFSVLTPLFTKRFGRGGTMSLALCLLTFGILLRVLPSQTALLAGTAILGIGIALGNVLLPGIVKERFPRRFGMVTGIYSAMLGIGATIASGISVPLSENAGFGWRWALGSWALVSLLALAVWLPQMKNNTPVTARRSLGSSLRQLGSSSLAWHVSIFMGLQSLTFYTITAWLPEILIDRAMDPAKAGLMLSLTLGAGAIGTFLIPAWASQLQTQKVPVSLLIGLELVGITGLFFPLPGLVPWLSVILGFSLGGSFGLALLFIVLRTHDTDSANELSGMSQSIGYTLAAAGPTLFGGLHDLLQNWETPLIFLLAVSAAKCWSGWGAGKDQIV